MSTRINTTHLSNQFPLMNVTLVLKGLGQIMLQENAITGFLFLLGIFYGSPVMGAAALLATICGTATAILLRYDQQEIEKGLYGFSAALVGVGLMLFFKPSMLSWILVIVGSSAATIIQHFFLKRNIPVFTLPFVLVTWGILFFASIYSVALLQIPPSTIVSSIDYFSLGFKGYGQVIFQDSLISGLLFFLGVFISSPVSALYGFAAGIISALIAIELAIPIYDISLGLLSYNAVLCAIVFAGIRIKDAIYVLCAVLMSLTINLLMLKLEFIPLTFPFVLASFITQQGKNSEKNRRRPC